MSGLEFLCGPAIRVIGSHELRDGIDRLAEIELSDAELAERTVELTQHEWENGLGPLAFTFIELDSGEQYALGRLEYVPERVKLIGSVTSPAAQRTACVVLGHRLSKTVTGASPRQRRVCRSTQG